MDVLDTQLLRYAGNRCVQVDEASLTRDMAVGRDERVFGHARVKLSSVIGPCIAWIMWSPRMRFGGMAIDTGRAAHEAEGARWLLDHFKSMGAQPSDVELTLVGGSHPAAGGVETPLTWAQQWAQSICIPIHQQDVGGRIVRRVTFNLSDGSITIAHGGRIGFSGGWDES